MPNSEPIVDVWMQHPTPEFVGHPIFASLRRWMGIDEIPEEIPVEMTLGAMDAAGVDLGLLSAWWGPQGPIISNDEVAEIVGEHPDRFAGVASVDISEPMAAVEEIERCVDQLGFVGVRLLPWLWEVPPDHRRFYPVYVACVEHDVPFCLQVGHTGPLLPSEPGRPIPYLDRVALDFPELTIVAGHVGHPWTREMVALARKYPNIYIDTSAYKAKRFPDELVEYMRADGADRVLFGSNYPMIQPADCFDGFDELDLDPETRTAFLHENARRVFELEARPDN